MRRTVVVVLLAILWLSFTASAVDAQSSWDIARARGAKMPKRLGVGVSYYNQKQAYGIDSLILGLPGWDPAVAAGLDVTNETTSIHAVLDYWLLPYLNVELLVGNVDGETRVGVSQLNLGLPLQDITVKYDGIMYGGGFTLAGGWDYYFVSLTTQYTKSDLDVADSSVQAWVVTPKFGVQVGESALWVGAMYQNAEESHRGTYDAPFLGEVPFDVTLHESEPWNYLAGISLGIGQHLVLNLEGGFGNRDSVLAHLSYRF